MLENFKIQNLNKFIIIIGKMVGVYTWEPPCTYQTLAIHKQHKL